MALSNPVARTLYHSRQVNCNGYLREDGMWDIDGKLMDTRSYSMHFYDGRELPAGEPLHEMHVRITVDNQLVIHQAEACTLHSPFSCCPDINAAYKALVGLRIGPGFNKAVRQLFSSRHGCTHITELLSTMATTAFQTVFSGQLRPEARKIQGQHTIGGEPAHEQLIDSCYGWRHDGAAVAELFPARYAPYKPEDGVMQLGATFPKARG